MTTTTATTPTLPATPTTPTIVTPLSVIDPFNIKPPEQTWQQFVESMPRGKSPQPADIFRRWDDHAYDLKKDDKGKDVKVNVRSLENGEQKAYMAWIAGTMEPEEQRYLSMLTLRTDQIVLNAVLPVVRHVIERLNRQAALMNDLNARVKELEAGNVNKA